MSEKLEIIELDLDNKISPLGVEYHCLGRVPINIQAYGSITRIIGAPTKMKPGRGMPELGAVNITLQDFKISENEQGTYFGRLLGANEFFENRKLYIHHGNYSDNLDIATLKKRLYIIKSIDGPNSNGVVSIKAVDPLSRFFETDRLIPEPSNGELAADLTPNYVGALNITNNDAFSATGGVADIEGEWVRYSSLVGVTDIVLTERNVFGTINDEHKSGDSVKNAFTFESVLAVDLINQLHDYVGIDPAYIELAQWNTERDDYLSSEFLTGGWSEPEKARDKIDEICEQTHVSTWWNDEEHKIKLQAIGPNLTTVKTLEENTHILSAGQSVRRDPSKALTRVWIWFDKVNHSEGDTSDNYRQALLLVNPSLEADDAYGEVRGEVIFASHIPAGGGASVSKLAERLLSQRRYGTYQYSFQLHEKDADIQVGQSVDVVTSLIQSKEGVPVTTNFMVIERDYKGKHVYKYKAVITGVESGAKFASWAPDNLGDYETETDENKLTYVFYSADDGTLPNGDDPHLWL
ncbi:MAG: hypothetical protein COC04_00865 [Gammaproteobacteria bacterium]|nr:MAG: hypothetical protein COC04_00865 [Gammaproteobacteria bacterium]